MHESNTPRHDGVETPESHKSVPFSQKVKLTSWCENEYGECVVIWYPTIRTLEEAERIAKQIEKVLFRYPEHSTSAYVVADIKVLRAVMSEDQGEVLKENSRLVTQLLNMGIPAHLDYVVSEGQILSNVYLDETQMRNVTIYTELIKNGYTVILIDYESPLHNKWCEVAIRD